MVGHSSGDFVDSRSIGDAIVTVISEGSSRVGDESYGLNVVHVRIGDASIMVDTGVQDPSSRAGQEEAAKYGFTRTPGLIAGLATVGVRPEEITHVLITHAHGDHFVGAVVEQDGKMVPRFPNAHYFLNRADWEGNPDREQPDSELMTRLGPIDRLGRLELVDGDREIVPGVTMVHAPGESPGHSIVRVRSRDETFYALGDLFHHASLVEHPERGPDWQDRTQTRLSRERLIAEAVATQATLVFTHALFPPWGRVVSAGSGYRWEPLTPSSGG
jgi:glyoxylase-like metal-dependent hydrolase (beta-lactamase superfamily II)